MDLTRRNELPNFLILVSKSINNFIKEYINYDEKTKRDIFLFILMEIEKAVIKNNINKLNKLSELIDFVIKQENLITLKEYYENCENPLQSTNLVILACKHDRVNILEYLFSSDSTLINNLSKVSKISTLLPEYSDGERHNAFYYAVRSNNVDLLEKLINMWPDNYFFQNLEELDHVLSAAHEELKLKNVALSEEIERFVQSKLIDLRFFSNNSGKDPSYKSDFNSIRKRFELVLESINQLNAEYSNDREVGEKFLFISRFIAKNLHVLKRLLKSTYARLPWEEIEFCLVSFIHSITKFEEINLFFNVVLNKNKILKYLDVFGKKLSIEMDAVEEVNLYKIAQLPNLQREKIVSEIIKNNQEFKELYNDYKQIRDMHCLKKMGEYINMAVSCDPNKREGQLIILRTLQMMGEYLKNTLESPNLSPTTSDLLLLSLPKSTRQIIIDLRNSLSHAHSLFKRTEIEENIRRNVFIGIQNDIATINDTIKDILKNNRIKQIIILLKQFVNTNNLNEMKTFAKIFKTIDFQILNLFSGNSKKISQTKIEELVNELNKNIPDQTSNERKLFDQINEIIRNKKTDLSKFTIDYAIGLVSLKNFCAKLTDDTAKRIGPNDIRKLKFEATSILENIDTQIEPNNLKEIAKISMKIAQSFNSRVTEGDFQINTIYGANSKFCRRDNLYQVYKLVNQIFYFVEFETSDAKQIEQLREQLHGNKSLILNRPILYKKTTKEKYTKQLERKLIELNKILSNFTIRDTVNQTLSRDENNAELEVASEMVLLDILSILNESNKHLENNLLFLDDNTPLLIGKSLRDHLAHNNALINILPYEPSIAIFLNAKKFLSEDVIKCKRGIGKLVRDDISKLKYKYDQSISTVTVQNRMFTALEEGSLEKLKECLKEGADFKARTTNLWTALHFAAKSANLEMIKLVRHQNLDANAKNIFGQKPLHISAVNGRTNTLEYLLQEMNVMVDDQDNTGNTPLILAAKNGHKCIVNVLLTNKSDTNIKDNNGFSAIHYAVLNNHMETVKVLLEKENDINNNQASGGFTLLHLAAEKGHAALVNFFLANEANVNATTDQGVIPLYLAALNGHLEVVNSLIENGANVNFRTVTGITSLHNAAENGHLNVVNVLLKQGADVNAVYKIHNLTPLHFAAKGGYLEVVKILIKHNANINIPTGEGLTPLHFAALGGHTTIGNILLKHGVNIHMKAKDIYTPLHCAVEGGHADIAQLLIQSGGNVNDGHLNLAARNGHKDIIDLLIKNNADVTYQDINGMTPLHSASINGNNDIIDLLVQSKANVNAKCNIGMTPLHVAVLHGHQNTIRFLIECKADCNAKANMHLTPLAIAVNEGHKEVVELLIANGANVNMSTLNETPLSLAIKSNNSDIVEILLANGANVIKKGSEYLSAAIFAGNGDIVDILLRYKIPINATSEFNFTPLHVAALRGNNKIMNSLLDRGADVNAVADYAATPLFVAANKGYEEVIDILLSNGAKINDKCTEGSTAMHIVAANGYENSVNVLLTNKANINIKDDKNRTPLELAVAHGHLKVVRLFLQYHEVNINAKGNDDFTILHIAAQRGYLEMVKYLTNEGCNINAKNVSGSKPIHIAAREGHKNIVEYFIRKGITVNDTGAANQTLLHYTAILGQPEVARYLITKGADINARDINGSTALHVAANSGCKDILKILLEKGAIYNVVDNIFRRPIEITNDKTIINMLSSTDKLFKDVKRNDASEVEKCLKGGACVNAKNVDTVTSLHYAAWKGYDDVVDVLLQNNADPNTTNNKKITPLHYATKFSNLKIVQALLSHGAVYNAESENGKIPLDFAVDGNITRLLRLLSDCFKHVKNGNLKVIDELKKINDLNTIKAIMSACNREGKTLVVSAIHNNFPKVEQLKEISQGNVSAQIALASMCLIKGDYQNALRIYKNIFEKRKEILGADNPGTLEIQGDIATTLYKQGLYQEALIMIEEIFQKQENVLGSSSKDTLNTRSMMALVMHRQGKNNEAFAIYQDVYGKQKEILGENHSDTLTTQLNMALVLDRLGKYEEALNINRAHFERLKKQLGQNNPETIIAQNNIALVLNNQGKCEEALKIYKEVYEKKKIVLGATHTDTLRTLHNIALILARLKKFNEAIKTIQEVLDKQITALGNNHPETLNTQFALAKVLYEQGKSISALKICKRVVDPMKQIFGSRDERVLFMSSLIEAINMTLKYHGNDVADVLQHLQNEINTAASTGDVQTIKRLINDGAEVNDRDANGVTPLHYAVSNGHVHVVNILLQNGADVTEVSNKGNTPLHIAISKDYLQIVEILLRHINPSKLHNFVNTKTITTGTTALHVASKNGSLNAVMTLLKHDAIFNIRNKEGKTALDLSSDQKVTELLELIDNLFKDATNGNIKMIEKMKLLNNNEFLSIINARNENGNTLIQVAIVNGQKNIAQKLIEIINQNKEH